MSLRKTAWTGLTAYGQLASTALTGFISVPLALKYLTPEEFGLWSFAWTIVGYLLLIDLGVGNSIGRLMAEPLHRGNQDEVNRWFSLNLLVLTAQAILLLGVGLPLVWPAVRWFQIPSELQADAAHVLTVLIVMTALTHPFRLCGGILFAQNRAYLPNLLATVISWINLAAFATFLALGFRSRAYAYAMILCATLQSGIVVWFLLRGPTRFSLVRTSFSSSEFRELFRFSSSLFLIAIAVQIVLMSQGLILTKFLGLAAVASFNICTKLGQLGIQLLWRPFDSFAPRWQQFFVTDARPVLNREFERISRFTIAVTLCATIGLVCLNAWFVRHWAKPELYLGRSFDLLFATYLLVQTINHCLSYPFVLSKNTKALAWIAVLEAACSITVSIWAVQRWGVNGLMVASVACTICVSFWWIAVNGLRHLGLRFSDFARYCRPIAPILVMYPAIWAVCYSVGFATITWLDIALSAAAFFLLTYCLRGDLAWGFSFLQKRRRATALTTIQEAIQ